MAGLRRREPPVRDHQAGPVPAGLVGQLAAGPAERGIGQGAPAGAGARQALLPQHRGRVQALDYDLAVGLGESGGQDVEVVAADAGDPAVQPGDLLLGFEVAVTRVLT
jgi:hypothetical protein